MDALIKLDVAPQIDSLMPNLRVIARLDVKAPSLIKGVRFEGLRKLGNPKDFAERYYAAGIDEILYVDAVASLYRRNTITELVQQTARDVFIPITAGGGVRSIDDARALLRVGADKVAINTAALHRPGLISEIAHTFGSQCVVLSVQAKRRNGDDGWEAYSDQGREHTGRDVIEWVCEAVKYGVGEILLTSVDRDGTGTGFDLDLIRAVSAEVDIPLIASGGLGTSAHLIEASKCGANAIAVGKALHYDTVSLAELDAAAKGAGIAMRSRET